MKIQEQVCTKSQAMRLKELGVAQNRTSLYYWYERVENGKTEFIVFPLMTIGWGSQEENGSIANALDGHCTNEIYAAFTVAELGAMLPTLGIATVKSNDGSGNDFYWCQCHYFNKHETRSKNEAEARAEMLIWILEQKHNACTVEEVNQRLTQ